MEAPLTKFTVVGLITSVDFQKCRYMVTKLHFCLPKEYDHPEIRPMFDVEWNTYLIKMRRRQSHGFWAIQNVCVIMNGVLLGNSESLAYHISKKYRFAIYEDWTGICRQHISENLILRTENVRQLVYLTIAIDFRNVGTMLFLLYNDLVPHTCENFMKRYIENCGGNKRCPIPITRIVEKSWIQCGDPYAQRMSMRCENYVIPHDQRGVLSMCNNGRHKHNTVSFCITLDPTPWMDYNYVGFGQMLQGDDVLKRIEEIPTYYQSPNTHVEITSVGEFPVPNRPTPLYEKEALDNFYESMFIKEDIMKYLESCAYEQKYADETQFSNVAAVVVADDAKSSDDSVFSLGKYQLGLYSLPNDAKTNYKAFMHLPEYLLDVQIDDENPDPCATNMQGLVEKQRQLYDFPSSSDLTI